MDEIAQRASQVSTLPQIAAAVMKIANSVETSASDLRRVVENDPALSARVLRMANSASAAVRTPVTNLHQAISLLGFNQVRNLAMTASVSELFRKDTSIGCYQRRALWRHLVMTGICARLVASRVGLAHFEDAFLAGLLHDIGVIIEDEHDHDGLERVIGALRDGATLPEIENAKLGYDHTQLGRRVAEQWGFPPSVRAAIHWHHASHAYRGAGEEIVRCVEIANVICTMKGVTSIGRKMVRVSAEPFRAMGFNSDDVLVLAADVDAETQRSESFFEL